jgi:type IV pilus assembly protein PilM
MFNWKKQPLPIGVDIGHDGVRALQLVQEGESPKVRAAAREKWDAQTSQGWREGKSPTPKQVKHLLDRMLKQNPFVGRRIVTAMPREMVRFKSVRVPAMNESELSGAAVIEAQRAFELSDTEDYCVRWISAGEVRQGTESKQELILLAARQSEIDNWVESWHACGYQPMALDFEASAIYRSIERFVRRRDDEQDVNVLVDIGARKSQVLIGRGRELNFYKTIDVGGAGLTQTIAHKLGIESDEAMTLRQRLAVSSEPSEVMANDPVREAVFDTIRPAVESLAREISLCLRYYSVNFRGRRPLKVRLVGGEASDPAVVQILGSMLPVPVEAAAPLKNADMSGMKRLDRGSGLSGWTTALGLALRFCEGRQSDWTGPARTVQQQAPEVAAPAASAAEIAVPTEKPAGVVEVAATPSKAPTNTEVLSA